MEGILSDQWTLPSWNGSVKDRNFLLQEEPAQPVVIPAPTPARTKLQVSRVVKPGSKEARLVGNGDLQSILPMQFPAMLEFWFTGRKNDWTPTEVSMRDDLNTWNLAHPAPGSLTPAERNMVLINLSFFSTAESRIGNHVNGALYNYINNPEARLALSRLQWEESIHVVTFMYIIESLQLDESQVYGFYEQTPSIRRKDMFLADRTHRLANQEIDINTDSGRQEFMEAIYAQMLMEGVFFYSGFAMNLRMRDKLPGIAKQYEFIMRDESLHMSIIRTIFNTLKDGEWRHLWTPAFQEFCVSKMREAVEIEYEYTKDCVPENGIAGLSCESFYTYLCFIADRRLEFIGLKPIYNVSNPFPWLASSMDMPRDPNFFEEEVSQYQMGGLRWSGGGLLSHKQ